MSRSKRQARGDWSSAAGRRRCVCTRESALTVGGGGREGGEAEEPHVGMTEGAGRRRDRHRRGGESGVGLQR